MAGIARWILALLALTAIDVGSSTYVPAAEWAAYKNLHNKNYTDATAEYNAQYYYAYNKNMITSHNTQYDRGQKTFELGINQFTDMRLIHFNALFPVATPLAHSNASAAPLINGATPAAYDPAKHFGYMFHVENQGTKCNSGWAYSAVKAIEMLDAQQTGILSPVPLSAQNIIDCAGSMTACSKQVPQTAYDYLAVHKMALHATSDYPNNNAQSDPGMCVPKGTVGTKLDKYSVLANGDDESLKRYVGSGMAVVVQWNPTSFEFMHYSKGIYQPPTTSTTGSHYMVVEGYDTDAAGQPYWILRNSFGCTWGEQGLMRLQRSSTIKLANNAIFPTTLA